jgi:MFS family permease
VSGAAGIETASPPGIGRSLWPGIAVLIAVMGISRFAYTPILPEMLSAGVLDLTDAGWVAGANFLGYLAGALMAALVVNRATQNRLLLLSLLATAVLLALIPLVSSVAAWMVVRGAAGVASAFALVFVSNRVFERMVALGASDRTVAMFSGVSFGIIVAALLCLVAASAGVGWQGQWWLMASASAVFALLAWRSLNAATPPAVLSGVSTAAPVQAVGAEVVRAPRAFAAAVMAYGLFGFGYVIHATFLPAMIRAAGYSATAANLSWVLVGAVSLPAIVWWRWVARRLGARAALTACYACEGISALAPIAGESLTSALIAAVGLGAGFIPLTGMALPFARSLDARLASRAVAFMTVAFGVGQMAAPVLAASLAQGRGFLIPCVLSSAALLLGAALMAPRFDSKT